MSYHCRTVAAQLGHAGSSWTEEVIPQEPESDFSEDFEEPQLLGSLLRQHEARGHWPYDKGCDSCVQARGGLLPGDVVMKEQMIKVLHLP